MNLPQAKHVLVHLFRQAKFVKLKLFCFAYLPFLHCRGKQRSQNLVRHPFSSSAYLDNVEAAVINQTLVM